MDATLQALGGILLKAVPTLILLFLLHLYLKTVFFGPLQEVLKKRREATEGAREAGETSVKKAAERTAEYEAKLRDARSAIYREQEEMRKKWIEEQTARLDEARNKTRELVEIARKQLDQELAAARQELTGTAAGLADQITTALLERRVN